MINESEGFRLTFESASLVTQSFPMITFLVIAWFLPLAIYLIIGMFVRGKSASGQVRSKPMILYPNFWIAVFIWGVLQAILLILFIFPIWLNGI